MVEEKAHEILAEAQHDHVAFLVVGDPFGYAITFFSMQHFLPSYYSQFDWFGVFFPGLPLTLILLFEPRRWELKSK